MAIDGWAWVFQIVNLLLIGVFVFGVPAAIIYGVILLRRIARNTGGNSD